MGKPEAERIMELASGSRGRFGSQVWVVLSLFPDLFFHLLHLFR
jgi:hypothetical protein